MIEPGVAWKTKLIQFIYQYFDVPIDGGLAGEWGLADEWGLAGEWGLADESRAEWARLGRLFNMLMLMSVLFSLSFGSVYVFAQWNGWIINSTAFVWQLVFALAFIPLALFCGWQTRRGHLRSTFMLYIWLCLLFISAAVFLFGGSMSPWWLLYFWPLALTSVFLPLWYVPGTVMGVLFYYAVILWATSADWYQVVMPQSPELFRLVSQSLTLMLFAAIPGMLNFLNTYSNQKYLQNLRGTAVDLERARSELTARVDARTVILQKRADQFQAIAELSHAVAAIRDLSLLLDTTTRLITERLGFYHVGIFLIDSTGVWAVLHATSSEGGQRMLARGHRLHVGADGYIGGLVGYVSETGVSRIVQATPVASVGEDAVWFNNPDLPDTQSEMALPLIARENTIGVLDIQTTVEAAFSEEDVAVLRILADSIAIAIANTRSFEETRAALERLSRYQEQDALRAWRQALERLDMRLDYTYASGLVNRAEVVDAVAVAHTIASVEAVQVTESTPGVYVLEAPITIRQQKLGILSFEKNSPWTDEQLQFTSFVVEQLDLALDNARMLEETQLRAQQQRARSEIIARVRIGGSTDAIMRGAVEELGRALQVERSRIQLLPQGEW